MMSARFTDNGPVQAFAAFLDFAQLAHIGKQTTFGLGKIRVTEAP